MEYKITTKLKQSTLWQRLKLIMTHNFTESKAEVKCPPPPPQSPMTFERVDEIDREQDL